MSPTVPRVAPAAHPGVRRHEPHDELPQQHESGRPAHAGQGADQVDEAPPAPILLEHNGEHHAADQERDHDAEIDEAIRLGHRVAVPHAATDREEDRLGHAMFPRIPNSRPPMIPSASTEKAPSPAPTAIETSHRRRLEPIAFLLFVG
jgi:hypothetical protein